MTDPKPVTVRELLLALASFPQDAVVYTAENGGGGGAILIDTPSITEGNAETVLWEGHIWERPRHYLLHDVMRETLAAAREVLDRVHPGDDFATASEFLEWLRSSDIVLRHPGHGHNESDGPVFRSTTELAEAFARRRVAP